LIEESDVLANIV